jgi:hypothetical protein
MFIIIRPISVSTSHRVSLFLDELIELLQLALPSFAHAS